MKYKNNNTLWGRKVLRWLLRNARQEIPRDLGFFFVMNLDKACRNQILFSLIEFIEKLLCPRCYVVCCGRKNELT